VDKSVYLTFAKKNDWFGSLIIFLIAFRQNIQQQKTEIQARVVALIGSMRLLQQNKPCRDIVNLISQMIYKMEVDRVRRA
jgi:hypothetical protein